MPAPTTTMKATATPTKPSTVPRHFNDADIGAVPPRPIVLNKPGVRQLLRKRADTATDSTGITLSQNTPTVKRANSLRINKLTPWTKGNKVAAPAPLPPSDKVEDNIQRPSLDHEDSDDLVGISTGTFHGLMDSKAMKLFPTLNKHKHTSYPPLEVKIETRSYISSVETLSLSESSKTTCVDSSSPSPDLSLSTRTLSAQTPSPTLPPSSISSATSSSVLAAIPKELHREAPQAHNATVQPSPLRANSLSGAEFLDHFAGQIGTIDPPSRPSSAPSLFGGELGPVYDPEEDEYWKKKPNAGEAQLKVQQQYRDLCHANIDALLYAGEDIDHMLYNLMSDEQKDQLHKGPWRWEDGLRGQGKWVKDPKKWAKLAKKVQKEEKVQGKANKL